MFVVYVSCKANRYKYDEIYFVCCKESKAANRMHMRREAPDRRRLDTYKSRRLDSYINEAAAKLWLEGVALQRALEIVREAFHATISSVD